MRHKKKFINKKNATVFKLIPIDESKESDELEKLGLKVKEDEQVKKKRIEEQIKYGVYFEDDYNYLQHLRERKPTSTLVPIEELPELCPSVRESARSVREDTGEDDFYETVIYDTHMMSHPPTSSSTTITPQQQRPEFWDLEIEEALKNPSSDPEELEDDFFVMANQGAEEKRNVQFEDAEMDEDLYSGSEDEEEDMGADLEEYALQRLLKILDDGEEEEDREDEQPPATNPITNLRGWLKLDKTEKDLWLESGKLPDDLKQFTLKMMEGSSGRRLEVREVVEPVRKSESQPMWPPPESPYSRASNHVNGPKFIDDTDKPARKISLDPRTGIPKAITLARLRELEAIKDPRDCISDETLAQKLAQECTLRPRGETPEEKRERKSLIKKHNRERRMEKKANRVAFKQEEVKQKKQSTTLAGVKVVRLR